MTSRPYRDIAFATVARLRCHARLERVLNTIPSPRQAELASAIGELDGCDDTRLKHILADVIQRDDAVVRDATAQVLGDRTAQLARGIQRWIARGVGR